MADQEYDCKYCSKMFSSYAEMTLHVFDTHLKSIEKNSDKADPVQVIDDSDEDDVEETSKVIKDPEIKEEIMDDVMKYYDSFESNSVEESENQKIQQSQDQFEDVCFIMNNAKSKANENKANHIDIEMIDAEDTSESDILIINDPRDKEKAPNMLKHDNVEMITIDDDLDDPEVQKQDANDKNFDEITIIIDDADDASNSEAVITNIGESNPNFKVVKNQDDALTVAFPDRNSETNANVEKLIRNKESFQSDMETDPVNSVADIELIGIDDGDQMFESNQDRVSSDPKATKTGDIEMIGIDQADLDCAPFPNQKTNDKILNNSDSTGSLQNNPMVSEHHGTSEKCPQDQKTFFSDSEVCKLDDLNEAYKDKLENGLNRESAIVNDFHTKENVTEINNEDIEMIGIDDTDQADMLDKYQDTPSVMDNESNASDTKVKLKNIETIGIDKADDNNTNYGPKVGNDVERELKVETIENECDLDSEESDPNSHRKTLSEIDIGDYSYHHKNEESDLNLVISDPRTVTSENMSERIRAVFKKDSNVASKRIVIIPKNKTVTKETIVVDNFNEDLDIVTEEMNEKGIINSKNKTVNKKATVYDVGNSEKDMILVVDETYCKPCKKAFSNHLALYDHEQFYCPVAILKRSKKDQNSSLANVTFPANLKMTRNGKVNSKPIKVFKVGHLKHQHDTTTFDLADEVQEVRNIPKAPGLDLAKQVTVNEPSTQALKMRQSSKSKKSPKTPTIDLTNEVTNNTPSIGVLQIGLLKDQQNIHNQPNLSSANDMNLDTPGTSQLELLKEQQKIQLFSCDVCQLWFVFEEELIQHHLTVHTSSTVGKFAVAENSGSQLTNNAQRPEISENQLINTEQRPGNSGIQLFKTIQRPERSKNQLTNNLQRPENIGNQLTNNVLGPSITGNQLTNNAQAPIMALFQCKQCTWTFDHKSNLKRHLESVHFAECVNCNYCGRKFKNPRSLKDHISRYCGRTEPKPQCNVCKKKFDRPQRLKYHYMNKPCGKISARPNQITNRVNTESKNSKPVATRSILKVNQEKEYSKTNADRVRGTRHTNVSMIKEVQRVAGKTNIPKCPHCQKTVFSLTVHNCTKKK